MSGPPPPPAAVDSPGYEKLIQSDYFVDLSLALVRHLRHERATHLVTGFEKDLGADTLVRVEGSYKTFDDLIVGGLEPEADRRARVREYVEHDHRERHHQELDNRLLQRAPTPLRADTDVQQRKRLGGLLNSTIERLREWSAH